MSEMDNVPRPQQEIGRMLRQARRERGLSLHKVEDATKIRAKYLADLEREDFDVLPAVYVQGSLKTYANFLGLDGRSLAQELKRRQQPPPEEPTTPLEPPPEEPGPWTAFAGGAVAAGDAPREAGPSDRAGTLRLYLVPVAFLTMVLLGVSVVAVLGGESRRTAISQVREPALSASAPRVYQATGEEDASRPSPREDGGQGADEPSAERSGPDAGDRADEDGREEPGQESASPEQAQEPRNATSAPAASASATPSASAEPSPEPSAKPSPSPKPKPERNSGAGTSASASPEPSPQPVAAPVRGGSASASPDAPAGGGDDGVVVEANGLRISVSGPRQEGGPVQIQQGDDGPVP